MRKLVSGHSFAQIQLAPNSLEDLFKNTVMNPLNQHSSFAADMRIITSNICSADIREFITETGMRALHLSDAKSGAAAVF